MEAVTEHEIRKIVAEAVEQTLLTLGIDADEAVEIQKDMSFLRGWRESAGTVKRQGLMTAVGVLTVGFLGLIWIAVKGNG